VCDFVPCGSVRGVNVSEEYGASTFRLEESSDLKLAVAGFSETSVTLKEHGIVSQKAVILIFGVVRTSHITLHLLKID
jgi:hypothetical protein